MKRSLPKESYYSFDNPDHQRVKDLYRACMPPYMTRLDVDSVNAMWIFNFKRFSFSTVDHYIKKLLILYRYNQTVYSPERVAYFGKTYEEIEIDWLELFVDLYKELSEAATMSPTNRIAFIEAVIKGVHYELADIAEQFVDRLDIDDSKKADYKQQLIDLVGEESSLEVTQEINSEDFDADYDEGSVSASEQLASMRSCQASSPDLFGSRPAKKTRGNEEDLELVKHIMPTSKST